MIDPFVLVHNALNSIYRHSFDNKREVSLSRMCRCFGCKSSFVASSVEEYCVRGKKGERSTGSRGETTAVCPNCSADAVIGDASGIDLTPPLMDTMHEFWFERKVLPDNFDFAWFSTPV